MQNQQKTPQWMTIWEILKPGLKWMGILLIPVLTLFSHSFLVLVTTVFIIHLMLCNRKTSLQLKEAERKLYLADRDIKTLHGNQKMLQSSLKEIYKDLKIYGEIKRARIKSGPSEKEEG